MAYWRFTLPLTEEDRALLAEIPGVKVSAVGVSAPENAAGLVEETLRAMGRAFTIGRPTPRPKRDARLATPWLREWVPAFLTSYQREGVMWALNAASESGHLWWPTGCLTGDTKILVNRGGRTRAIELGSLVAKLQGKTTRNPRNGRLHAWDLSILTYAQSVDDEGFVRLNKIEHAYENGVKDVFEVTTKTGRTLRATAEHYFMIPGGTFVRLRELREGDRILVAEWPKSVGVKRKPQYRQVDHMWNHPHAVILAKKNHVARVPEHRLIAEARENGITLPDLVGRILLGRIAGLRFLNPAVYDVHHRDRNTRNNNESNLEVKSKLDHQHDHGVESAWKHVAGRAVPDEIVSVRHVGVEPVFDLGMTAPMENYIANEFVVHNSGKSLGSIVWALSAGPTVTVAAVKASIRRQWSHEVEMYSTASVIELEGQKSKPIAIDKSRPVFIVVSYEILPFWIEEIEKIHPTSCIYDEVHHVKSWRRHDATVTPGGDGTEVTFDLKDNQAAAAYRLSRATKRRLSTTRTPIKDRPRDLWAQLDLVHPWEWGSFYGPREKHAGFAWRYCAATESPFGGIDTRGRSNLEELKKRLAHVVHTIPYSVTHRDLPAKRRLVTYVAVKDQVRAEGFAKEIKEAMKGVSSGSEGRARLFEIRVMEAAARKRKIVLQHVTECVGVNEKVVVFTGRRRDADQLAETFREKLPDVTTWVGHGGHSHDARDEMRVAYMAHPGPCVLVGTGEAWGTGLNLQDTDRAIFAMLPYTPGDVVQREGRFCRLGQKRPVLIHYLICEGTVDEHVASILLSKFPAVERVTDFEEVAGLGRELIGASEEELLQSMFDKVIGGANED